MNEQYRLQNIRFSYKADPVLRVRQQVFFQGQISALIGANGAGKSTLLRLLALLIKDYSGTLRIGDATVTARSDTTALRREIVLVPQNPYLIRGSVRDNIALGLRLRGVAARERERRTHAMLALLQLESLADRPAAMLSGGEAQKVAVGRVLVLNPAVILLDEPFTHLDRAFVKGLGVLVQQLKQQGKTIIFSSHDRLQAQLLSDRSYTMIDGDVVQAPLYNLFHGRVCPSSGIFDTGRIRIAIPAGHAGCRHLAVAPTHIVLSIRPLDSSMRNAFAGRVQALTGEQGRIRVLVRGEEDFCAYITAAALDALGLRIGSPVLVNFKSSAVQLF